MRDLYQRWFTPSQPLPAGIYHYQSPGDNPLNYRLHLRLEPNGNGILIINASTVLHLNATAAEHAYHLVQNTPADQAAAQISKRYRIDRKQAEIDFSTLKEQVETLITTIDLDPISYFGFERHTPYSDDISAPYRLDCALTYQLPNKADQDSTPTKRVKQELTTGEWKNILDKAWAAGIPHVVFTGGEPTLRDDLPELISYAEKTGQITGILSDGVKISDTGYLDKLLQAGLDHAMIVLHPDDNQSWQSLASFSYWAGVLKEDIYVAAHLTLTANNADQSNHLLDKLAEVGVSGISLSANEKSLSQELLNARAYLDSLDLELIWDLPVPYTSINPVALELENEDTERLINGAGVGWLYVEPDGDVLPGQGINIPLGNILNDNWDQIWGMAKDYRRNL